MTLEENIRLEKKVAWLEDVIRRALEFLKSGQIQEGRDVLQQARKNEN